MNRRCKMPTYDYECTDCGFEFEEFHSMSTTRRRCPACGELKLKRLIGAGGGIILKGAGFYKNDYRSRQYIKDKQYSNRQDRKSERLLKNKYKAEAKASKASGVQTSPDKMHN